MQAYCRHFLYQRKMTRVEITAEQNVNKPKRITEFFVVLQEMQSFAEKCRQFIFRKCSMMLIER